MTIKMHLILNENGVGLNSKILSVEIDGNPQQVFSRFKNRHGMVLLESNEIVSESSEKIPRWSYIACVPVASLQTRCGITFLKNNAVLGDVLREWSDPFDALRDIFTLFKTLTGLSERPPGLRFLAGLVGYLGYDLARYIECLPSIALADTSLPDMHLEMCDHVLAFEHTTQAWFFCTTQLPWSSQADRAVVWQHSLTQAQQEQEQEQEQELKMPAAFEVGCVNAKTPAQCYLKHVRQVLDLIKAGDILQANLSHRLEADFKGDTFSLYIALTQANPALFSAYLCREDFAIASVSPERFLMLTNKHVQAKPIKGTRPRGETLEQDEWQRHELQTSVKDKAENVMIVDLMRNDLGRVAALGSVRVDALFQLEPHPSVWQMVSTVSARLRDDADTVDLLRASWPPGSMTGAPKIRAMEIIDATEPVRRGPYAGTVGYFDVAGDFDLSVVIRTAVVHQGCVMVQVGGAIVADSVPVAELEETYAKGRRLFQVLGWQF